eukprot:TRINITY_DN4574_c1_g1_i1.p2 TRINITY_DN4574_c1_g1~~TRINITY_DN4574_c1_g1_i1.p2  ORF type:complete len:326 (+),score=80.61 TRINITY_DN4574_c1_g1_i1:46-1023(+)
MQVMTEERGALGGAGKNTVEETALTRSPASALGLLSACPPFGSVVVNAKPTVRPKAKPNNKPRKKPLAGALSASFLANCAQPVRRLPEASVLPCDRPSQIRPWLYLGSCSNAMDRALLKGCGITTILNTALECDSSQRGDEAPLLGTQGFDVLNLGIRDHADENLANIFGASFRFIDQAKLHGKKVLVHCRRGISRSAAVVIAYLIQSEQLSLDAAFEEVLKKRSIICPNLGFVLELERWVHSIKRATPVTPAVPRKLMPAACRDEDSEPGQRVCKSSDFADCTTACPGAAPAPKLPCDNAAVAAAPAPPSPVPCPPDSRHAVHA